jgi:UDP-N-acetyl-D-mannosaminuronic acid dehydrogenase
MNIQKQFDICIIGGCGHVGLPLGLAFASKGQKVVLYDIDRDAVEKVNKKVMPFLEEGAPEILAKVVDSGMLVGTTDGSVISQAHNLILIIGTPVDEHLNPRLNDVMGTIRQMIEYLKDDQLIVLRSTLYPGVTQKIHDYLRSQGISTSVAFCPERIAEGHALREFRTLPQIVSGCDSKSIKRAKDLFSILANEIVELSSTEAELAKLFTNTWRYINFAISNQFYMIANSYGLDFYRIYEGMVKNYPRLQGFAKAGFAAGPCLFKDTMQLSAFSNNNFFMGHAAMLVNEGLPNYIVEHLRQKVGLREKIVGILGMAFKANNDDPRESLSYKLKKILELEAAKVVCSDVYISEPDFVKTEELIEQSDVIILATPHREYRSVDLKDKPVVDIWNFFGKGGNIL